MCLTGPVACGGPRAGRPCWSRFSFRLTARRGTFPFLPELGSRLWQLGQLPAARRQSAAEQYVAEALAAEPGLTVEQVILTESGGGPGHR